MRATLDKMGLNRVARQEGRPGQGEKPYAALSWFYDRLLGDRFFPLLRRNFEWLIRQYGVKPVLTADIACGTGTFIRYLSCEQWPVAFGVDRSPAMLRIAARKNRESPVRFLCQDFSHLRLPRPVGLITCNFDSLNYLLTPGQLLQALCRLRANLSPGGWGLFDLITPCQPWTGEKPLVEDLEQDGVRFQRRIRLDRASGLQISTVRIASEGCQHHELHRQRVYPPALVAPLIRRAGFHLHGMHDFESLEVPSHETSRVVYVVRRIPSRY